MANNYNLGFDYGRQMLLDQRNKTLVCFCNHLKVAEKARYSEIHGKYSLIQLLMEDFSKGKKNNATYVYYNLSPKDVRTIFHWVSSIYPLGKDKQDNFKLYKTLNGQYWQLDIQHNPKMNNPFGLIVTNGEANEDMKPVKKTGEVKQWYSYELFYSVWSEIYDKLKMWELIHYSTLSKEMEPITAAELDKRKSNKQDNQKNNKNGNWNSGKSVNNKVQQPPLSELPPLAPPPISEDEVAFDEMPAYGSAYKR